MESRQEGHHITALLSYWIFRVILANKAAFQRGLLLVACVAFCTPASSLDNEKSSAAACPEISKKNQTFSAKKLERDSIIAIEGNNSSSSQLVFYRNEGDYCRRQKIAVYRWEGGPPSVDSLFFEEIAGKMNLITIVRWTINHRGLGTFGNLYQVSAYQMDSAGTVIENNDFLRMGQWTGIDGYSEHEESSFPFRTAAAVRKYLRSIKINRSKPDANQSNGQLG